MPEPIIVSTWTWGTRANQVAWKFLTTAGGIDAVVDAVVAACMDAENDANNLTVGDSGYPDASGRVSLDAAVMVEPARLLFNRRTPYPLIL